ncbi:MAG: DUF3817 domain-containing protein [Nocardioidaceae bacterium]
MSARTVVPLFKAVALLEGLSWLGLLIGMYLKWIAGSGEAGVQLFGPIHGGVFVAYVVLALVTGRLQRWSIPTLASSLVASVPPFGTVVFEVWAQRTGRLTADRPVDERLPEPALD